MIEEFKISNSGDSWIILYQWSGPYISLYGTGWHNKWYIEVVDSRLGTCKNPARNGTFAAEQGPIIKCKVIWQFGEHGMDQCDPMSISSPCFYRITVYHLWNAYQS